MITLDILYEDSMLIAVNKSAGILVVPDRWDPEIPTLQDLLREYLRRTSDRDHPNLRVVHRLDKDTSGVIVFAKDVKAQAYVSKQFENGEVSKTYHAIVKGVIRENDGVINHPILESDEKAGKMMTSSKGKRSITRFTVLERFNGFSLVEANPLTGRTHQVRVHLASHGHPLALDPLYGRSEPVYLSQIKKEYKPKDGAEKPLIPRIPLHSLRLTLKEPVEEKTLVIEAPVPKDFARMLKMLRKYCG
ncbi:MAG: RluA family pseudouridine synthase [Acidobacteria bacterium]|nr:MAG: RluA family pseudouridine synthase [Acidobacteriota bacterium]